MFDRFENYKEEKMSYFTELDIPFKLKLYDLDKIIDWRNYNQICLNSPPELVHDHQLGVGRLKNFDHMKVHIPVEKQNLCEENFTEICEIFKESPFEELLNFIKKYYTIGRARIIKLGSKQCFYWHTDNIGRLHYPLKTQSGCLMVIDDEVKHLMEHHWYYVDTTKYHTAINGSDQDRLHIVITAS